MGPGCLAKYWQHSGQPVAGSAPRCSGPGGGQASSVGTAFRVTGTLPQAGAGLSGGL